MSGSLNKVILIGNLGKDPDVKMTTSGQLLAKFSVATTETWRTPGGEKRENTEWHNIVAWGKLAEIAEKYLRKGKQVMVEGRIQYQEYKDPKDPDGPKKKFTSIRCDNFVMLGRMDESSRQGGGSYERPSASSGPDFDDSMPSSPPGGGFDDDIPF